MYSSWYQVYIKGYCFKLNTPENMIGLSNHAFYKPATYVSVTITKVIKAQLENHSPIEDTLKTVSRDQSILALEKRKLPPQILSRLLVYKDYACVRYLW